jgi:arsenate reductase (thioredoxin)
MKAAREPAGVFALLVSGIGSLFRRSNEIEKDSSASRFVPIELAARSRAHQETKGKGIMSAETRILNVLFLCTGNSARSIMAETILNAVGQGRFKAYSAGSHPTGRVNPFAMDLIRSNRFPTADLRSKDWAEFAEAGSPQLDFVFTVCDKAAGEVCPIWPGQPMTAHWGVEDPAAVEGAEEEKRRAFSKAWHVLNNRIRIFSSLPLDKLDKISLKKKLDDIGKSS